MIDLTQFLPGLVLAIGFGLVSGPWAARRLDASPGLGRAVMIALGAIIATTLSPGSGEPEAGAVLGACDVTRLGPASLADLTTINEVSLNIVLFVPFGVALGLLPRSHRSVLAIVGAMSLPVAIELIQLAVPGLARYCDSADVADNLTGLLVGLVVGVAVRGATRHRKRSRGGWTSGTGIV